MNYLDKELEKLFDDLEKNAYNIEYHNYDYKLANQIIRKRFISIAKQYAKEKWISVKDRLPDYIKIDKKEKDYSENVFTTDGKDIYVMARCYVEDADGWLWGNCLGDINGEAEVDDDYSHITHWMSLPSLPKELQ